MLELFDRFQSTCNAVFRDGRAHLTKLVEELPDSFLVTTEDGHGAYFVWLTKDYTQGTTVIFLDNTENETIVCDVSYGNYTDFDATSAENAVRQLAQKSESISVTGGAMTFDQGSEAKLIELYGKEPLRYMLVTGALELSDIDLAVEINPVGSMNMTAELSQTVAE